MPSSSPLRPKPFLTVVAAVVCHIAFLLAPDVQGIAWILILYGVAILTLYMIRTWLAGGTTDADESVRLRCLVAGALADALVFVGAGYSTSIEPGVIKLGGVLPLGWSCAILALLDELIRVHGQNRGIPNSSNLDRAQVERWVVLAIGTVIAMGERLLGQEPNGLKYILTALLVYAAYTCWRRYRAAMRHLATAKD